MKAQEQGVDCFGRVVCNRDGAEPPVREDEGFVGLMGQDEVLAAADGIVSEVAKRSWGREERIWWDGWRW